jgi:cytochrome c biogenesis protein CcdA
MKTRNLIFSLGAISVATLTIAAASGLAAAYPLKIDPTATFAALIVAVSGLAWFRKIAGRR